jgi:hypothetical protein
MRVHREQGDDEAHAEGDGKNSQKKGDKYGFVHRLTETDKWQIGLDAA